MFPFFFLFFDFDTMCDPKTLTTNLGYVCEIVVERTRPVAVVLRTHHGPMGTHMVCHITAKLTPDGFCEREYFILKYEWVIEYSTPFEWSMPTKWGMYRHPNLVYTCGTGWHMNGHGVCEYAYMQHVKKKGG